MKNIFNGIRYSGTTKGLSSRSAFEKRHKVSHPLPRDITLNNGTHLRINSTTTEYIMEFNRALSTYAQLYNEGIRLISLNGEPRAYQILSFEQNPHRSIKTAMMDAYTYDESLRLRNDDLTPGQLKRVARCWQTLGPYLGQLEDEDVSHYAAGLFHVLPDHDITSLVAHAACNGLAMADVPVNKGRLAYYLNCPSLLAVDPLADVKTQEKQAALLRRRMMEVNGRDHPWGLFQVGSQQAKRSRKGKKEIMTDLNGVPVFGSIKEVSGGEAESIYS